MAGPLLIDSLIANGRTALSLYGGSMPKSAWGTLTHAKYNAQRFVFDAAASEIAGDFAVGCPDLVFGNRQFAVPPYPLTYVEIDARAFFRNAATVATEDHKKDDTLAYLVDGHDVYCLFARKIDGTAGVGMALWTYKVMEPGQYAGLSDVQINVPDVTKAQLLAERRATGKHWHAMIPGESEAQHLNRLMATTVMFGSAVTATTWKRGGRAVCEAMTECSMRWIDPECEAARLGVEMKLMQGFMGDVRNYYALMLWLNQQSRVSIIGMPAGSKLVRGKRVPFLSHNLVTISLGQCKTVRRAFILANERNAPKRHPVRGHFKHRHGRAGCVHDWPLRADDDGHFICRLCGRMRWWVASFERGTAERGFATHDYAVTE